MTENISKEHLLFEALREDPNVYIDDEKNVVNIGDTIKYIANNQLGKRKYRVIESLDENGNVEKGLEEIEFSPSKKMTPLNDFTQSPKISSEDPSIFKFHWYPDDGSRGGKKKHKKTQHRRKRKQMSKSKSKKMKSKKYRRRQK
jgi:hypothetical protein